MIKLPYTTCLLLLIFSGLAAGAQTVKHDARLEEKARDITLPETDDHAKV